ncbi:MAG: hypothetical protein KGL48_11025 [Sphingomonadales bacterium]|nr:hypothetical protein [Sphingomonadales bacterium]
MTMVTPIEQGAAIIAELIPFESRQSRTFLFLVFVSLFVIAGAALLAVSSLGFDAMLAGVPDDPAFWAMFGLAYAVPILADWIIFRFTWRLPLSGIAPLLRKSIANNVLIGYAGDAYLYNWARQKLRFQAAPFGVTKDVAVLSAMVGNGIAMSMLLATLIIPSAAIHATGLAGDVVFVALVTVVLSTTFVGWLRRRIFTLPAVPCAFIAAVQVTRLLVSMVLAIYLWRFLLPTLSGSDLLRLTTLRLLVSRLPLVPCKDVVFAGATIVVIGMNPNAGTIVAMLAMLTTLAHAALGTALFVFGRCGCVRDI